MTEPEISAEAARPDNSPVTKHVGGALFGALVAIAYYAIDRSRAFIVNGPPDPLSPFASHRIDYFWRIAIAFFLASMAWAAWSSLMGKHADRGYAVLSRALIPVVVVAVLLSLAFP
jgi:hypothetical protein